MNELQEARAAVIAADRFVFAYRDHRHELGVEEDPEALRKQAFERWNAAVNAFNAGHR